ncbi:MAG TPA: glycosyl hydrolase [Thermomicrobiaceae bacterium]|nr:glycosyl hydrolase [Thermomicrobiaceae bacterium]
MKARASARGVRLCVILVIAAMLPFSFTGTAAARNQSDPQDFFGIVGRDPWYEYNTDPAQWPNQVNQTFMDSMNAGMQNLGARWERIEIHGEYDQPVGPGRIDYSKTDWFIQQDAPSHGLKILAVLGTGIVADLDKTYQFNHINDPLDASGENLYSRAYVQRAHEIVSHYGDAVGAYEILNEPNANLLLSQETHGATAAVNPIAYGRVVTDIYSAEKAAHPNVQFIAGSLLYDDHGTAQHLTWLQQVMASPAVQQYVQQHKHFPWDGVSIHPYNLPASGVLTQIGVLHNTQASHGDGTPIWVTEIGMPAAPPDWTSYGIMDPTSDEQQQATFLHDVYTALRDQAPYVDHVFWFKYEDFGSGDTYANWGLVRLRDSSLRYGPDATPWPRKLAYSVYQSLARPGASPAAAVPAPANQGPGLLDFPPTGHTLSGPFLTYWQNHGGLSMFGYPTTEVFYVQGRAVQYFERARFEYWPEFQGTPYEVQLGLLGRYVTRNRTFPTFGPPTQPTGPDRVYFPQTQEYLAFGFKTYWEQHGGLAMFGYPISPEIQETNPADGKTYTVQYFERARFEYHPEFKGTPYEVELGLLGNEVLSAPGWYR